MKDQKISIHTVNIPLYFSMKPTDRNRRYPCVTKISWMWVPVDLFTFGQYPVLWDKIGINLEYV